jgi:hypothetical protein
MARNTKRRTKPNEQLSPQQQKLFDLLTVVTETAKAKGWQTEITALDKTNFRYATVMVHRVMRGGFGFADVSGLFEITCDQKIKISYQATSFHNYGLADLYDAISNEFWKLPWVKPKQSDKSPVKPQNFIVLQRLIRRFHNIARQLKHRHEDRSTIIIKDEYDVQDLLHSLLRGLYDDVRAEEYCPSYAGSSSKMDFLLKEERVVIETKMTNAKLKDKQVGEQLIIDIKKYQQHPDCGRLICFVYDPNGYLKNPVSLETDLSGMHDKMEVKVIVVSV